MFLKIAAIEYFKVLLSNKSVTALRLLIVRYFLLASIASIAPIDTVLQKQIKFKQVTF